MSGRTVAPVVWVQLAQAMVARALVVEFGLPERHAASRLGLVPSAVSQYLSGKRLAGPLGELESHEGARRLARRVAQELLAEPETERPAGRRVLETAVELAAVVGADRTVTRAAPPSARAA